MDKLIKELEAFGKEAKADLTKVEAKYPDLKVDLSTLKAGMEKLIIDAVKNLV